MNIKEIMKNYLINSEDEAHDAIDFVWELMSQVLEETKRREPYATRSIARMENTLFEISELHDLID